eukprot:1158130-Pelagomonas_calceolata.AAC.14
MYGSQLEAVCDASFCLHRFQKQEPLPAHTSHRGVTGLVPCCTAAAGAPAEDRKCTPTHKNKQARAHSSYLQLPGSQGWCHAAQQLPGHPGRMTGGAATPQTTRAPARVGQQPRYDRAPPLQWVKGVQHIHACL